MKNKNDLFDYENLKIYQGNDYFKFSLDSILLAEFVDIKMTTKSILDLCTGNAPIPMILSTKTNANIVGFEIQENIYNLAEESIITNNLETKIKLINADANNYSNYYENEIFDIVTCNPPYFKVNNSNVINKNTEKGIARHEVKININDIIVIAKKALKSNGCLYLSHRANRLNEIMLLLKENKFGIKKLQFIYYNEYSDANLVLIKAMKNGVDDIRVSKPIFTEQLNSYQNIFEE